MCEFCNKIGKMEKIKQGAFKGGYYPETNETQIVEFENAFHLFVGCSDPFMSGIAIENIKLCPICGRRLCDETETPIEHFLKSEIERSKLQMNAYAECFDGIHVDNDTRKKLLESHIRFCQNALKQCMDV